MAKNRYAAIFAMLKEINASGAALTKEDVVRDFTGDPGKSLSDLSDAEVKEIEISLRALKPRKAAASGYDIDPLNKARRAIIAHFKSIGRTTQDAIDWAEKYGVNGVKRKFNDYNGQELYKLIRNAGKVKADFIKSVNKKL